MARLIILVAALALAGCATTIDSLQTSEFRYERSVSVEPRDYADCLLPKLDTVRFGLIKAQYPLLRRDSSGRSELFVHVQDSYVYYVDAERNGSGTIARAFVSPSVIIPAPESLLGTIRDAMDTCAG